MSIVRQQIGFPGDSQEEFDEGLAALAKSHRRQASIVYDAVKKIPSYVRLANCRKNEDLARQLLSSSFVGFAPRGYGIRLDHPGEDKYLTQLHQDYTSQLSSPRGVVLWSPLRKVTPALGPVKLYPGSHRTGIQPVEVTGSGSYGLRLRDEQEMRRRFVGVAPELNVGDVVAMDFLLLHESSPNQTDQTRWAMISRYFDFTEKVGASYGWKGGLAEGNSFAQVHPELTSRSA
jgi:ectoine hydroxylase-related dioxygenase (phytanoyl-CoA dioxygenase family)